MLLEMAAEGCPDRVAFGGSRPNSLHPYKQLLTRARRLGAGWPPPVRARRVRRRVLRDRPRPVLRGGSGRAALRPAQLPAARRRLRACARRARPGRRHRGASASALRAPTCRGSPSLGPEELPSGPLTEPRAPGGGDIAVLLFTSGTTGAPKAAVLRHRNLASYIFGSVEFGGAGEDEAALVSVPPYHIAGDRGAAVVGLRRPPRRAAPSFDPRPGSTRSRAERVTHAMVVPTMLGRILDVVDARRARACRRCAPSRTAAADAACPSIERAMRLLPRRRLRQRLRAHRDQLDDRRARPRRPPRRAFASDDPAVRRRLGSVGRAAAGVELDDPRRRRARRVAAGRARRDLRARRAGLGRVPRSRRASTTTAGSRPATPASSTPTATSSSTAALDDVIVRGGENLSPGEIEDVLRRHPRRRGGRGRRHRRRRVGRGGRRRGRAAPRRARSPRTSCGTGCGRSCARHGPRAHRVPRRAALQRDRQAAAPGAARRAGCPMRPCSRCG